MRPVSRVDAQGFYVEDVLLGDGEAVPEDCVGERPRDGFHAPKWTGEEWVEGKPEGEILEALKGSKVGEIAQSAVDDLAPLFTPGAGRDETVLLVAAHVLKIAEALKVPVDPRLRTVVQTGQRALEKKAEVEAAGDVEEMEAVGW